MPEVATPDYDYTITKTYEVKEFLSRYAISDREGDVFLLLANGLATTQEISERLGLSPNTISNHLNRLLGKTNCKNKAELLACFLKLHHKRLEDSRILARRPRVLVIDADLERSVNIQQQLGTRALKAFPLQNYDAVEQTLATIKPDVVLVGEATDSGWLKDFCETYARSVKVIVLGPPLTELPAEVEFTSQLLDFNDLSYLVYDAFIEAPKLKTRFHRVTTPKMTALIEGEQYSVINLGFGGLCLSVPRPILLKEQIFRKNKSVHVEFDLGVDLGNVATKAEVCWVRKKEQIGLNSGVGLKFLNLDEKVQCNVRLFVRRNKELPTIEL